MCDIFYGEPDVGNSFQKLEKTWSQGPDLVCSAVFFLPFIQTFRSPFEPQGERIFNIFEVMEVVMGAKDPLEPLKSLKFLLKL